jgi:hypothetical protein
VIALLAYWLTSYGEIENFLHDGALVFAVLLAILIILSALIFAPSRPGRIVLWGALSPFVASAVSYGALAVAAFSRGDHTAPISISSVTAVSVLMPYFVCRVWLLTCGLIALGLAFHYLVPPSSARSGN